MNVPRISQSRSSLCDRCKLLDFDKILDTSEIKYLGEPEEIVKLGNSNEFNTLRCGLCKFFSDALRIDRSKEQNAIEIASYSLYSYPFYMPVKYMPSRERYPEKGVFLMLAPSKDASSQPWNGWPEEHGYIMPTQHPTGKPAIRARMLHSQIDFSVLRSWMDICNSIHTSHRHRPYEHNLKHLRLINCHTLQIVAAEPNAKYVTLSYVYGNPKLYSMADVVLRSQTLAVDRLPNVVKDAIKVVREIGLQFLWVDRYCIPQGNPDDMKYHMSFMHKV